MHGPLVNPNVTKLYPPPKHLEKPEQALWNTLVSEYQFDDSGSLELLASAMEARARTRRCREAIDRDGECYTNERGNLKPHPLIAAERSARANYVSLMRMLRIKV